MDNTPLPQVRCNYCHRFFFIKPEYTGKTGRCKYCGKEIIFNPLVSAKANNVFSTSDGTRSCPYCGEQIQINAIKCKHCGEFLINDLNKSNGKKAALRGAILCLIISTGLCTLNPFILLPFYVPVLLASFILSIIAIAQNRIAGGIIVLLLTLISPLLGTLMNISYLHLLPEQNKVGRSHYQEDPKPPANLREEKIPVFQHTNQIKTNQLEQPDAIIVTDEDQNQLAYLASFAEAYYAEAERIRSNIQQGNASGNRIFEEKAAQCESQTNDAKKTWLDIQNKYFPEWTERQKDLAWQDAVEAAKNTRLAIEQTTEAQQKVLDAKKFQELQRQRQIQRAIETEIKIGQELQRKAQIKRNTALYNAQQIMKQEEIRRQTGH